MDQVLVAGHICLDIIPEIPGEIVLEPGRLFEVGPALLSTGGAVSNTGLCLTKLGVPTTLIGKVGEDPFGRAIREILDAHGEGLGAEGLGSAMTVVEGEHTSYTVVLNLAGQDRTFLHAPGCNATFSSSDVPEEALRNCRLMHFGYPPLLARMFADNGEELVDLFRRAKGHGVITSLDMTLPDARSSSGRADWRRILDRTLPFVDIFAPSLDELLYMLDRPAYEASARIERASIPTKLVDRLAAEVMEMGVRVFALKASRFGLFLRTASDVSSLRLSSEWNGRSLWAPSFQVEVAGTTGAGDATIGGFLMGVLRGMGPEDALTAAVAVGACCCESPDAVSGVRPWPEIEARIRSGWSRVTG
jgi:sugar/nucleoside kinase (ribokinase family)